MFIYNITDGFNTFINDNDIVEKLYNMSISNNIDVHYIENRLSPQCAIIVNLDKQLMARSNLSREEIVNAYFDKSTNIFKSKISINNPELKTKIIETKNNINKNNKIWDKIKTITNDYEFVCINNCKLLDININYKKYYSRILYFKEGKKNIKIDSYALQISRLNTLSRSFYKMIEIINTFYPFLKSYQNNITTLHLAEGPGGFIEALNYIRNKHIPYNNDLYYGITLLDDDNDDNIPTWKKSLQFLKHYHYKVKIITGVDSKGDLLNPCNIRYLKNRFTHNKCQIITGDGGIDFSGNVRCQEEMASKLIYAQLISAICCLDINGNFILKIFDINNILTIDMLFLMYICFNKVYIYKPKTSRLANSEKYIVCNGFKGCSTCVMDKLIDILEKWNEYDNGNIVLMENYKEHKIKNKKINFGNYMYYQINNIIFGDNDLDKYKYYFYKFIDIINTKIINQQIKNINYTLNMCNLYNNKKLYYRTINQRLIKQTINATYWCTENEIPFNHKF